MFFGEVRVDEAQGLILAHSLRLSSLMLKKGHVLDAADVQRLKVAGINFVTGARLDQNDAGENEAASILSTVLAGGGVTTNQAFAGRCNLFADHGGLLVYDRERLDRLNMVDEAVTVATAPAFEIVPPRQMIATVKIIPFGVDRRVLDACQALAERGGPLISVRPFAPLSVGLILTTLPGVKDSVLDNATTVTGDRVRGLNGSIAMTIRCPHEVGPLERTIAKVVAAGCQLVLIIGATATVDRRDVVPCAIERAGGVVNHFGMPVDPGNLLLLGHVGAVPLVNLPGCARSPKPNGLDWVLRRLFAGVAIKPADVMRMGAGGLLKQGGGRPAIRQGGASVHRDWRLAALILAAGGNPLAAVEMALAAGLDPVLVALPPQTDGVEDVLPHCECQPIRAASDDPHSLLACGLASVPPDCDGVLVLPGDCDGMGAECLNAMIKAFDPDEGRALVLPQADSCWGLVASDLFPAMSRWGMAGTAAEHAEAVFVLRRG